MIRLERRAAPSRTLSVLAPVLALAATALIGLVLFAALGRDPVAGLRVFFVTPLSTARGLAEIGLRMTPLLLCALGLCLCYRANVWNIGAEGQLVVGGLAAGAVALLAGPSTGAWFIVPVVLAGAAGGAAWGGLTALLRTRFNANEILVSLMLTYVGQLLLMWAVNGPLKDPNGRGFPYSRTFEAVLELPKLVPPYRLSVAFAVALALVVACWLFLSWSVRGFWLQVSGASPAAARYAGIPAGLAVWTSMLACGALAGLAGAFEVAGPLMQLTPSISPGYGFSAIIVAWLGRLHPVGCLFASFVVATLYIGAELAQSRLGLPNAIGRVFQGTLLMTLLCADVLVHYRPRVLPWTRSPR